MVPAEQPIEIFKPFGEAFELTKKILFAPFDLGKWFVIGFAAWLATFFSGGGGGNFRRYTRGDWRWDWHARHEGPPFSWHDVPTWVIPFTLLGILLGLAVVALLLWLHARGRFIFTDCIVRNRGAIVEPWREYREESNQFFVFQALVALGSGLLFGGTAALFFWGKYGGHPLLPLSLVLVCAAAWLLGLMFLNLLGLFLVPVMYRRRCGLRAALRAVWELMTAKPGVFVLFALFYFVLCLAAFVIGCVAGCVTCCVAALPYIGTVILLPVVMVLFAFPLCFLRQFGESYDVWAGAQPAEPPTLPPVQEPLPPA